jgi:hypothetical protein
MLYIIANKKTTLRSNKRCLNHSILSLVLFEYPTKQRAPHNMSSSDWDPAYEASLLNHWYTLNRILLFITPLIYLFLSVNSSRAPPLLRGYRITLPLLTAFFAFCLFTEAYYLALPIYVCFFPVRGKTYHAKEETRLGIQWKLYLVVGVLAFAAAGVRLRDKIRENQGVTSMKMDTLDANNRAMIGVKI